MAEEIYLPGRNLKRRRMAGGGADSATALLHSAVWTDDTQDLDWSMVMNQFGLNAISPPGDGHCQFRVFCLLFWRLTDDSAVMAMRNYLHQQFTQFEKDFRELIPFAFNSSNLKSQLLCSNSVQWGDVLTLWVVALCFGASIIVLKMTAGEPNELINPGAGRTVVICFDSVGEHYFAAVSHSAVVSFQMDELDSIHGYSFFYKVPVETVTMDMVKQDFKRRWGFTEM